MNRPRASGAISPSELGVAGAGLIALIAAQMLLSGTLGLLTQPLWLDECLTHLLANDPSFFHAMAALRGGADTNPPALYVVLWPLAHILGGVGTIALRVFAVLSMVLALVGLYAVCRLFTTWERALVGTLAVAAHPVVVAQAFQARFYGPWLAATTWFVYAVLIDTRGPRRRWILIARSALAVLLVTTHWFGVIALLLIGATDVAVRSGSGRRLERAIPLVTGLIALALCLPFLIGQRQGLTVATWIDPVTAADVRLMAGRLFGALSMLVLVGYVGWRLVARIPAHSEAAEWRSLAPVLALLLFPVVITGVSLVLQPALLSRYLIVTVVPLGVLTAVAAVSLESKGGRLLATLACAGMVVTGTLEMRQLPRVTASSVDTIHIAVAATEAIIAGGGPVPIVFIRRFEQYPVVQQRPSLAESIALLDFDGVPDSLLTRRTVYERDMARRVNRFYPRYRLINVAALRRAGPFLVITIPEEADDLHRLLFGFDIRPRGRDVYFVTAR